MGTFTVTVEVGDPQGQRFESVQATVDTGASDTLAPRAMLERLGVPVQGSWPFTMADDREIEYDIGQTVIRIGDTSRTVLVVFGESDETILLGATSLETFHLAVDPVHQRLIPVTGSLKQQTAR
jgi:clan AA aspartic protease